MRYYKALRKNNADWWGPDEPDFFEFMPAEGRRIVVNGIELYATKDGSGKWEVTEGLTGSYVATFPTLRDIKAERRLYEYGALECIGEQLERGFVSPLCIR
mgnify:CR=1 FL=1|jgi:hypothetical protein|tara:strand:- start:12579 stop:12881 length:303 start_codon:yes stop_codon:yes gene_type:complete